jgi:hypothetical protein
MEATMKLRSALLSLCLTVLAAPAMADQLFLNHNNCSLAAAAKNKNLNCASTTQTSLIFASFVLDSDMPQVIADAGVVDLQAGLPDPVNMPDFWEFQAGGCSGNANFTYSSDFSAFSDCVDLWAGLASGAGQYGGVGGPVPDGSRARIKWSWFTTPGDARNVIGGEENYISRMLLRNARTLACPGCPEVVCVVYNEDKLSDLSGNTRTVINPDYITFNDATGGQSGCPGATPTKNESWGRVKALYR